MIDDSIQTWEINNRINLYLLNTLKEEHLLDTASSKGRNVGEQFAHIHNVRLMWLKESYPEGFASVEKIEKNSISISILNEQLNKSGTSVSDMLRIGFENNRIKGFKPNPTAFLGYLIAHESHHRGQIALSLKQSGHPIDKKTSFGLWEWGTK